MICAQSLPIPTYSGQTITLNNKTGPLLEIALDACCACLPGEQDPIVRHAICLAMTYLGEELQSVMAHKNLYGPPLAVILQVLQGATGPFRQQLFTVLDTMCETAGERLVPFLDQIMKQLEVQLGLPELSQQEAAIAAITSISFSVDKEFTRFFAPLTPLFNQILSVPPTPQFKSMQEKALVALSACSRAVGLEAWTPDVQATLMALSEKAFGILFEEPDTDDSTISANLVFLGNVMVSLAEVAEINPLHVPFLTKTYDACIRCVRSLKGVHFTNNNLDAPKLQGFEFDSDSDEEETPALDTAQGRRQNLQHAVGNLPGDGDDEDEDAEDLLGEDQDHYFDTDALETKASAMGTLSLLVNAMGPRIYMLTPEEMIDDVHDLLENQTTITVKEIKYVTTDPVLRIQQVLLEASGYLTDHFLSQSFTLLTELLTRIVAKMHPLPKEVGVKHPLPIEIAGVASPIIVRLIEALSMEDDSEIVSAALYQLTEIYNTFGCSIIDYEKTLQSFYDALGSILIEDAPCLQASEYKDERSDQGEDALEAACELVGQLARSLGPLFKTEVIDHSTNVETGQSDYLAALIEFCNPARPDTFRANAIGCLAEILEHTGVQTSQLFVLQLFPLAHRLLQDPSRDVRHNTMYFVSECAHTVAGRPDLIEQLPQQTLVEMFQNIIKHITPPDQYKGLQYEDMITHDNAIAASLHFVASFPTIFPTTLLPEILKTMPLRGDDEEIVKISLFLPHLYTVATEIMKPFTGAVLAQIAVVLQRKQHSHRPQDEPALIGFARQLIQQFPQDAANAGLFMVDGFEDSIPALQQLATPQE